MLNLLLRSTRTKLNTLNRKLFTSNSLKLINVNSSYSSFVIGTRFSQNSHQSKTNNAKRVFQTALVFGVSASAFLLGENRHNFIAKGETKKEAIEEEIRQISELEKRVQATRRSPSILHRILLAIRLGARSVALLIIFTPVIVSLPFLYLFTRERFHIQSIKKSIWTLILKTLEYAGKKNNKRYIEHKGPAGSS